MAVSCKPRLFQAYSWIGKPRVNRTSWLPALWDKLFRITSVRFIEFEVSVSELGTVVFWLSLNFTKLCVHILLHFSSFIYLSPCFYAPYRVFIAQKDALIINSSDSTISHWHNAIYFLCGWMPVCEPSSFTDASKEKPLPTAIFKPMIFFFEALIKFLPNFCREKIWVHWVGMF